MHRCPNRACPSRGLETLINWVMAAADIEGVGEQFVRRLWSEGLAPLAARPLPPDEGAARWSSTATPRSPRRRRSTRSRRRRQRPFCRVLFGLNIPQRRLGDGAEPRAPLRHRRPAARGDAGGDRGGRRHRPRPRRVDRRVVRGRGEPRARRGAARARPPLRGRRGGAADRGPADRLDLRDHRHARGAVARARPRPRSRRSARRSTNSVSKKTTGLSSGEEPGARS